MSQKRVRQQRKREKRHETARAGHNHTKSTTVAAAVERASASVCGLTHEDAIEALLRTLFKITDELYPNSHEGDSLLISCILGAHGNPDCFDDLYARAKSDLENDERWRTEQAARRRRETTH